MGSVLPAVALYVFVSIFSSGAESDARWKILLIALSSVLVSLVVQQFIPGVLGALLAVAFALGLIALALIFWCKIDRKVVAKIVAAYFGVWSALAIVGTFLQR
jgi:uncharacterized membrane-anchored protein